jgi:hypothetical protein
VHNTGTPYNSTIYGTPLVSIYSLLAIQKESRVTLHIDASISSLLYMVQMLTYADTLA